MRHPTGCRRSKEIDMNIIIWLVIGGFIGRLASRFMHTSGQQGIVLDVVVGIGGALQCVSYGWLTTSSSFPNCAD
jgi:uncharacterized membrane protein YeaQ/YmgE (transglycosylase-associated protein family)